WYTVLMPMRCAASGESGHVDGPHAPPLRGSLSPGGADLAWGGPALRSGVLSRISPPLASITPVSTLISVDLPAPFCPISAWISPGYRRSCTSLSTATTEKSL